MSRVGDNVRALLEADDPLWNHRQIVEVVSKVSNQANSTVGTGPVLGDMSQTGVPLSFLAPTTSPNNRGLVRLCGISIPRESGLILLAIRQYATIQAIVPALSPGGVPPADAFQIFELPITTPTWSFRDGNIYWTVQYQPDSLTSRPVAPIFGDPGVPLGASTGFEALSAGIIYNPPFSPYRNPGTPPGMGVEDLSAMNEIRSPWSNTDWWLNYFLPGPGNLVMYASVFQPNPGTRPVPNPPLTFQQTQALGPEDQFVQAYPPAPPPLPGGIGSSGAIYGRVAGAMTVELIPNKRFVEQGPSRTLLEYNQKFPRPQAPHGNTANLTSLMSGPGGKKGSKR